MLVLMLSLVVMLRAGEGGGGPVGVKSLYEPQRTCRIMIDENGEEYLKCRWG